MAPLPRPDEAHPPRDRREGTGTTTAPPGEGGGCGVALGGERGPTRDDMDAAARGTTWERHDEGRAEAHAPLPGVAEGDDDGGRADEGARDADPIRALIVFAGDGRAPSTLAGELRARGAD
eukprot:4891437-Pleurochrysis_carterae.AAC.1